MNAIKKIFTLSLLLSGVISGQLVAKVRAIGSHREFENIVTQNGICVALFYDSRGKKDKEVWKKNQQLQQMINDISAQPDYDNADVAFIKINIAQKEFDTIMDQYGIAGTPCFIMFKDGRNIQNDQGNACLLQGYVTRQELESMIENYFGKEIKALSNAKIAKRQQLIREEKETWLPYFYPRDIFVRDYDPAQRSME